MLVELRVRDLGVIEETITFGAGMTALTGETGTGKTLVVEALELLVGARADPALVRSGAPEALVEGRFFSGESGEGTETVLARVLPASGRSRSWVDGRMSTAQGLADAGSRLVDLHGQHAHQSLLDPSSQRSALDAYGGIDTGPLVEARALLRSIAEQIAAFGGDEKERAREVDLLRHQTGEISAARIESVTEDDDLRAEEARLSGSATLRQSASRALAALDAEGSGVLDALGTVVAELGGGEAFAALSDRVRSLQGDVSDVASELRTVVETWEDDPDRLAFVGQRRAQLAELKRKYGATLEDVLSYRSEAQERLEAIASADERFAALASEESAARADLSAQETDVRARRHEAAPRLAREVESHLGELAMQNAAIEISVGEERAGDDVVFMLAANPGEPPRPLAKVASGGELARTMLALRLVVAGGRPTLVFDEVDAGIGGAAADAVGRSLASLGVGAQVLVVTHLPQVAAFAEHHFVVEKRVAGGRTTALVRQVGGEDRVTELARMLSGRPASESAKRHAAELLAEAARFRARFRKVSRPPD